MLDDTIAAIATPLGEGGLAVIRISGKFGARDVADKCFVPLANHSKNLPAFPRIRFITGKLCTMAGTWTK